MSNVQVKDMPGARFFGYYPSFPDIANSTFAAETLTLETANTQEKGHFEYLCRQWLSDAAIARENKTALPPKPISPASKVVLRQDLPNNGGTWIVQTDGPIFGVCPDLPPVDKAPIDTGITGMVSTEPSIDQKLNSIGLTLNKMAADLAAIKANTAKPGA